MGHGGWGGGGNYPLIFTNKILEGLVEGSGLLLDMHLNGQEGVLSG